VMLVEPFFRLWISSQFAANANVTAQIMVVAYWINGFALVPYAQLQATGRPDINAKLHLAELIPYLILLLVGLQFLGLPGAALAFGIRNFADCILLLWCADILHNAIGIISAAALLLLGAIAVAFGLTVGGAAWWSAGIALSLATLAWSWWCAPADMRELALRLFKNFSVGLREAFGRA
jgi:hypothetical protein